MGSSTGLCPPGFVYYFQKNFWLVGVGRLVPMFSGCQNRDTASWISLRRKLLNRNLDRDA